MAFKVEIAADAMEDVLLRTLARAIAGRGFEMLGVVVLRKGDGAVSTLGNANITQSLGFAELLRDLADQIEANTGEPGSRIYPSS